MKSLVHLAGPSRAKPSLPRPDRAGDADRAGHGPNHYHDASLPPCHYALDVQDRDRSVAFLG